MRMTCKSDVFFISIRELKIIVVQYIIKDFQLTLAYSAQDSSSQGWRVAAEPAAADALDADVSAEAAAPGARRRVG